MRNGQNKRMRGRNNHRKTHNPMARVFESNGPDVKIRGNPSHIAEKYIQLARDAQASGDHVAAENYYQHAEHYYRVIAVAQEQFRQNNPQFARAEAESGSREGGSFDDGEDDASEGGVDAPYGTREPQPYMPREAQTYQQGQQQPGQSAPSGAETDADGERLPSFITGGQQPGHQAHQQGANGHDGRSDRFPLHRRRRRHRGPRHDVQGGSGGQTTEDT
jgi:type II secretory pathway pseudopilin PulG